jgi:hypothetical protein
MCWRITLWARYPLSVPRNSYSSEHMSISFLLLPKILGLRTPILRHDGVDGPVRDGRQRLHPPQEAVVLEDPTFRSDSEKARSAALEVENGLLISSLGKSHA